MDEMADRLFPLPTGFCVVDKGEILTPGLDVGRRVVVPVWCFLAEIGGERILFDTGMNPIHVTDAGATFASTPYANLIEPIMSKDDHIQRRLAELGLRCEDITYVVNSHLHFDHCGGNRFFRAATIVVQRAEHEFALACKEYPHRDFCDPSLRYHLIEGDLELTSGVTLLATPGHSPGHQSALIRLPESGRVVLTFDAVSIPEQLDEQTPAVMWDEKLGRTSHRRLRTLVEEEGARVFLGHGLRLWSGWGTFPIGES